MVEIKINGKYDIKEDGVSLHAQMSGEASIKEEIALRHSLKNLIEEVFGDDYPQLPVRDDFDVNITFEFEEQDNGSLKTSVNLNSNLNDNLNALYMIKQTLEKMLNDVDELLCDAGVKSVITRKDGDLHKIEVSLKDSEEQTAKAHDDSEEQMAKAHDDSEEQTAHDKLSKAIDKFLDAWDDADNPKHPLIVGVGYMALTMEAVSGKEEKKSKEHKKLLKLANKITELAIGAFGNKKGAKLVSEMMTNKVKDRGWN